MPPKTQLAQLKLQDSTLFLDQLEAELAECTEVEPTYRNKVAVFMIASEIWHISELDYSLRQKFQDFLCGQIKQSCFYVYLKAFDRIKQHSLRKQIQIVNNTKFKYKNQVLFIPYHPDQSLAMRLDKAQRKEDLVWDFSQAAPEKMKRQVFQVLNYLLKNDQNRDTLRIHLAVLKRFYNFCVSEAVDDIEMLELYQESKFKATLKPGIELEKGPRIIGICRKTLFLLSSSVNWNAHVWYLDRFHFQPERIDPANPVKKLSFLEVSHKQNRNLLKKYMRYVLGISNLSISTLRAEMYLVRYFLTEINQKDTTDVCSITPKEMDDFFVNYSHKKILATTYNKMIISILHFFNFLLTRRYIQNVPFVVDYYLKKTVHLHIDRSVDADIVTEILYKLQYFPEHLRLMYLHLWGIGLRISEVCRLMGNAYYIQNGDTWVQIYQTKRRNYKRIPIPYSLYQIMKVYLNKYKIGPKDYVFQNTQGGAFVSSTFRYQIKKYCFEYQIQNGEYLFKAHDYRHTLGTFMYDNGVSLQGVRDYLGHDYDSMTRQYIDFMPKKLTAASDEYFSNKNSLAANLKNDMR